MILIVRGLIEQEGKGGKRVGAPRESQAADGKVWIPSRV